MKIPWKWCIPFLFRLSQAATSFGTVHLVFDAKITVVSTPLNAGIIPDQADQADQADVSGPTSTAFVLAEHELALIMPLHLLGKKSWNVYNQANIDKVRSDEAIERAKEGAAEERMQEIDAARRLAILRGEEPEPLPLPENEPAEGSKRRATDGRGETREKKKRKRHGEDDTDFEVRIARDNERTKSTGEDDIPSGRQLVLRKETTRDAPVVDAQGHINLFPQDLPPISHKSKSKADAREDRAEKTKARKEKQLQDQMSLRFDNAAGNNNSLTSKAWYETDKRNILSRSHVTEAEEDEVDMIVVEKDVWGNEDPKRKDREKARITSNDPLAMMKAGSKKAKEVERERKKWKEEREKEMLELWDRELEEEERRKRRKRKYGDEDADSLEGFRVNGESGEGREKRRRWEDEERWERRRREGYMSERKVGEFEWRPGNDDRRSRGYDEGRKERGGERRRERDGAGHRHGRDEEREHRSRDKRHKSHHRRD